MLKSIIGSGKVIFPSAKLSKLMDPANKKYSTALIWSIGVAYSAEVASATKAGLECWNIGFD
jgi:hypothetical protein